MLHRVADTVEIYFAESSGGGWSGAVPTKRKRVMVNLPPELEGPVVARARAMRRSVANYIELLIAQDVRASEGVAEDAGEYHPSAKSAAVTKDEAVVLALLAKKNEEQRGAASREQRNDLPTHGGRKPVARR